MSLRPPFNIHEEKENLILSEKENLKQSRLPVLPMIPQKLVHPLQSFKLSWQSELEKEKSLQQSKIVESNSRRLSSIESEKQETTPLCGSSKKEITHVETLITVRDRRKEHEEQKWTRDHLLVIQKKKIDSTENNNLQYFQTPVMAVVREENQLRQIPSQRQTNPQQWFNNTPTASGNTEPVFPTQDTVCRSIELASNSQDERLDSTNTDNLDVNADENQQMLETSQEYCGSKDEHEFNNIPDFQKNTNTGCEETASKSPFSFTMVSTPKSPAFDLFSPSGFGTTNTPDQMDVSYTSENINISLHSPQKDLGNIFGKTAVEDDYGFSFTSEPSSHTFATRKGYFNFPFSFGQDQGGASQSSGFKDFQSSQSTKQFTFF
ncbi:protein SIX6OS1-like [Protopterus annectens]|uniref:protein SIX6OS1-like n=1 Tax=Protopterus annectens TaxID=7888 RepID=UPI001CFA9C32|nr:protein SIX6OS1-like [Protopterus annectens]